MRDLLAKLTIAALQAEADPDGKTGVAAAGRAREYLEQLEGLLDEIEYGIKMCRPN